MDPNTQRTPQIPSTGARPRRVLILGSTGSIGTTTLDVIRDFPNRFEVAGLSTFSNVGQLAGQVEEFSPAAVCVAGAEAAARYEGPLTPLVGEAGLARLVEETDADIVVVATVGFAGLCPTLAAIDRGKTIALANKEVLVVGGDLVMDRARRAGVDLLPIDSEHNAIFQCLAGNRAAPLRRILLTASGGPLRGYTRERLETVSVEEALNHPTWDMGRKITIDSATLMNKGLEAIEACHLFDVRPSQIDVVVHPQSTVHSMVEFADGSVLAQMGRTHMYLPILNVLAWPDRLENRFEPLDLVKAAPLEFLPPDRENFPCLDYAFEAIERGATLPAAMNAANEIAVDAFLAKRIGFMDIPRVIRHVMDRHEIIANPDLDTLLAVDRESRRTAEDYAGNLA